MNQQQILDAQIRKLENELVNAYAEQASHAAKVADAEKPTGNAAADRNLGEGATIANNTLVMLNRMIETRETRLTALNAQMASLNETPKQ